MQEQFDATFSRIEEILVEAGKSSAVRVQYEEETSWHWPKNVPLGQRRAEQAYSKLLGLEGAGEYIAGTYGYPIEEDDLDAIKYLNQLNTVLGRLEAGDFRTQRERVRDRLHELKWSTLGEGSDHQLNAIGRTEDGLHVRLEVGFDVYHWPITTKAWWADDTGREWYRYDTWESFNQIMWGEVTPDTMASCLELSQNGQAKARGFSHYAKEQ